MSSAGAWRNRHRSSTPNSPVSDRLFGLLITTIDYRRRERWAWFALWYYPVFWTAHLVGGLPPGKEHVHQIVFIVLSLAGLLLPVREFFPRRGSQAPTTS